MKTAVVIIIHRRPDLTRRLIDCLRLVKPKKIYVIADGPRNALEKTECTATRQVIEQINWPCELIKQYATTNLGLRKRVVTGLNYVFKYETQAIILEDDLIPDPSFFRFCEELLTKYRNNPNIISIAGNNFQFGKTPLKSSYYFSRYVHSWGWATWRRAWELYDDQMSDWPARKANRWLASIFSSLAMRLYWKKIFDMVYNNEVNSWAYRWTYTALKHSMLTIIPDRNLVSNIGYGEAATHTKRKNKNIAMPVLSIKFPLKHPRSIARNVVADYRTERNIYLTPIITASLIIRSILGRIYELKAH